MRHIVDKRLAQSLTLALALALAAGAGCFSSCAPGGFFAGDASELPDGAAPDDAPPRGRDLARPVDLREADRSIPLNSGDLATPPDLTSLPDLTSPPDMALVGCGMTTDVCQMGC